MRESECVRESVCVCVCVCVCVLGSRAAIQGREREDGDQSQRVLSLVSERALRVILFVN